MAFAVVLLAIALVTLVTSYFFGRVGVGTVLITGVVLSLMTAAFVVFRQIASGRSRGAAVTGWQSRSEGGRTWQLKFVPGRRGRASRAALLSLRIRAPLDIEIEIKPEHWFDQLCKGIGIAREFQTGDHHFDGAYYIRGDIDRLVGAALKQGNVREAIQALFDDGCTELRLSRRWLQADWRGFDPDTRHQPGEQAIAALTTIAEQLPGRMANASVAADRWLRRGLLWIASIGFGGVIFLGLDYPAVRWWPLLRVALPWALGSWLLLAWVAAWLLRGQSRSHDHWGAIVGVGAVTCVVGSIGMIQYRNGAEDPSPMVVVKAPVVEIEKRSRKGSTSYRAVVQDWQRTGETLRFRIDHAYLWGSQSQPLKLIINTRAGRLGIEWHQGYAFSRD